MKYLLPLCLMLSACTGLTTRFDEPQMQWQSARAPDAASACIVSALNEMMVDKKLHHSASVIAFGQSYEIAAKEFQMIAAYNDEPYFVKVHGGKSGSSITVHAYGPWAKQLRPLEGNCA